MEYILTWNGVNGRVLSKNYIFDIETKPNLSFNFDSIFFETQLNNKFYYSNGQREIVKQLNDSQIKECIEYCDNFIDAMDYPVQVYRSDYVYIGTLLKSEAIKAGYSYIISNKEVPYKFCKLENNEWEPIYCALEENGRPTFSPDTDSSKYVLLLTKNEYDKLPERNSPILWYDFAKNEWVDKRTLERVKLDGKMEVRGYFEHHVIRTGNGRIPSFEYSTWPIQINEAKAYLSDEKSKTPFLDAMLNEISNEFQLSKKDLCLKIINHYENDKLSKLGQLHGLMYKYLYRIENSKTNKEIDDIINEVYNFIGRGKIINPYSAFPPTVNIINGETKSVVLTDNRLYHGSLND